MSLLAKIANNPERSLKIFILGLALFSLGACAIFYGYYNHHYWQMLGLALIALGAIFSAWGYIGIFADRLLKMVQRRPKYR